MSDYQFRITPAKTKNPDQKVDEACQLMQEIFKDGYYAKVRVNRTWSEHNPTIEGEFAHPEVYQWYLKREFKRLLSQGADIEIAAERKQLALNDPLLLNSIDEDQWDFNQKKLFLFQAERIALSIDRLQHYTGTEARDFQRYILFTNYDMHVEVFKEMFPDCVQPSHSVQMPAYHAQMDNHLGISLINIGVGPSNAKTCCDHLAVLKPDAMVMVGHCGGLRNHQEIGDFVLATGYMRADQILDSTVPLNIPITPNYLLNLALREALEKHNMRYRFGTVYTTANRNWEFALNRTVREIHLSRSIAIDMESATIATNGFRYRIPHSTLLCVSDKPLHGKPKLQGSAQTFYEHSKESHLRIVLDAIESIRNQYSDGLPNDELRALNEPLMGS